MVQQTARLPGSGQQCPASPLDGSARAPAGCAGFRANAGIPLKTCSAGTAPRTAQGTMKKGAPSERNPSESVALKQGVIQGALQGDQRTIEQEARMIKKNQIRKKLIRNRFYRRPTGCPAPWGPPGCSRRSGEDRSHRDRASSQRHRCCAGWGVRRRCCIHRRRRWGPS